MVTATKLINISDVIVFFVKVEEYFDLRTKVSCQLFSAALFF